MAKTRSLTAKDCQPFRYPGGKSKLAQHPAFRALLDPMLSGANTFYEGFVGSAAVTLDVAIRYPKIKLVMTDLDPTISGFWTLVAEGTKAQAQEFERLVLAFADLPLVRINKENFKPEKSGYEVPNLIKVEYFKSLRKTPPITLVERAWHAVFFNRTTFSGIAMSQPIGGYEQVSKWTIDCRYNAPKLVQKFRNLRGLFDGRLTVTKEDCFDWLKRVPSDAPLYLDPPYYVKGEALYPEAMAVGANGEDNRNFQHGRLASSLSERTNWLMSYDICPEIEQMYDFAKLLKMQFRYSINGVKKKWKSKDEFLICDAGVDSVAFETELAKFAPSKD